jgi:phosphoribosylformylglycinamidine synthase
MIHFFENQSKTVFAVQTQNEIFQDISNLNWLLPTHKIENPLSDFFVGPCATMIRLSTNVEITKHMGISGIIRIEIS